MTIEYWLAGGWALFLLIIGGALTPIGPWYQNLRKPSWQPPGWVFGPAWTLLLGAAAYAGILAWQAAPDDAVRAQIATVFAVNGVFHFLWSPLFFRLRRPDWALIEVPFLWASVLAMIVGLAPVSRTAALLIVPYLLWVSFAAFLNWTIVQLNARATTATPR